MAFFERTDERDHLVICNICNVKCSERSMISHRIKCQDRHKTKFTNGQLEKCPHDTGHIIKSGHMQDHLEFCTKYQSKLVSEFQKDSRLADDEASGCIEPEEPLLEPKGNVLTSGDAGDDWNKLVDEQPYHHNFSKLRIG